MEYGDLVLRVTALAILLLLSAFFSGSETAFFSLNSIEKDALRRRSTGGRGRFVHLLFVQPDEVLVTILTGNMFVNIFASSIAEALGSTLFAQTAELVSIAAMTLLLLVVGEMTPKNLAIRHALKFAQMSTAMLRIIHAGLRPVTYPLGRVRKAVLSVFPSRSGDRNAEQATAVLSAIRMGYQSRTIEESELRLLERFFRFREKSAADVMTPRVDVHALDAGLRVGEFLELLRSGGVGPAHLFPLYRQDVDHISGYVRRVDLVEYRFSPTQRRLSDIAHPIHAVPASKPLRELTAELRDLGTEMAVVVDEYGGTEGIVSFPGLVAYLFEDFLPDRARSVKAIGRDRYRVAGTAHVEEVAAVFQTELPSTGRTVAGLVLDRLGEFPEVGDEVVISGLVFRVVALQGRRVATLEVERSVP